MVCYVQVLRKGVKNNYVMFVYIDNFIIIKYHYNKKYKTLGVSL